MRTEKGSALLTVLWLTAALSAIGLAVAHNVRGETERASTNVDDAKASFIARGAIERALLYTTWGQDYYKFGQPWIDFEFPGAHVRVEFIPETSKLSLNSSRPEEIVRLLLALGLPEEQANDIATAIIDWRTPLPPLETSPFDAFYLSRSPSFLPPHSSFQENEELLLVKGITPDLYYGTSLDGSRAGLRDCISVFSSGGTFDINTARREVLIAAGLSPADAETIVRSRADHPVTDYKELAAIQQSLGPAGGRLRIGGQTMFTLRATARLLQPDGKLSDMRRSVAALGKFIQPSDRFGRRSGFHIVRWYDR